MLTGGWAAKDTNLYWHPFSACVGVVAHCGGWCSLQAVPVSACVGVVDHCGGCCRLQAVPDCLCMCWCCGSLWWLL